MPTLLIEFFKYIYDGWTLGNVADVLSIIGVGLTTIVAMRISQLRKFYGFIGRSSEILASIRKNRSGLSQLMNSRQFDRILAQELLRKCLSDITSLKRFMTNHHPQEFLKNVKRAGESLKTAIKSENNLSQDTVRGVYSVLATIEFDIVNLNKDNKWRPQQ